MKVYKLITIFLLIFLLSIEFSCASDINHFSHDNIKIDNENIISDNMNKTYTDLVEDINKSSELIKLESNYKYNCEKDENITSLFLNNNKFTIDGNNFVIDGNSKAGFIKIIDNSDVIIENIIIRNCNKSSIILSNSNLSLINVTFENNNEIDVAAAIFSENSSLTIINSSFSNNYAPNGASIYCEKGNLNITNTLFKNDNPIYWSIIYGVEVNINIFNSTFTNTTSKYATAIYNNYITSIKKSKFINLHANATSGAIAVKGNNNYTNTLISDCEFENISSAKNGGALFLDIFGDKDGKLSGYVLINNTIFNNCSSEFGGAIMQLGGFCDILNTIFINNNAIEKGGAIYTSHTSLFVENTTFLDNKVDINNGIGAAIFFDINSLKILNSTFKNNIASEAGAIYSYDSYYLINDSIFENNGEDIHTYFDGINSTIINCDEVNSKLNDTNYDIEVRYNGEEIIINPTKINASSNDSYFNLRDLNLVTSVKNQGSMGSCWAFGAAGAFESAFLIATNITLDISENNIQNLGLGYSNFGYDFRSESGSYLTSTAYFLSWLGAINTPDDDYDELGKISSVKFSPNAYRVVDAIFVDVTNQIALKDALTKYGALNLFVYGANSNDYEYFSEMHNSIYYYGNSSGNHYVTLVGWNDTYSKDNFVKTPPDDGAWICKNSWGSDWGDEGYYYLSYYDNSLKNSEAIGFIFENTQHYEKLYQVEIGGLDAYNSNFREYGDVFISKDSDIIAAVGAYFEKENTQYTISIYVDDNLVYTQTGKSNHTGYNTIKLNQYIAVSNNSVFSVKIKSASTPILGYTRQKLPFNNSYVVVDGKELYLSDSIAPIKVYAYHNNLITDNIDKYYENRETFFKISGSDGDNVTINFDGKNTTVTLSNESENISLGILNVGDYIVTIYHKNQTFTNHVKVKSTIDSGNITQYTIAYNSELEFSVQFLNTNGNPLSNKAVDAKFDGQKVLNAKTNNQGYLEITIYKGNSIGKHYLDYVNPINNESLRVQINIVSRFSGNNNINMYYFDGHSFKVRIKDDLGNFAGKNQIVTINIGKNTFKVRTDSKGYATLKIPDSVTPGKYTILTTFAGQSVKNSLIVKQVIKLYKVNVKKSAKKIVLKAILKQGSKILKSKKVTFKFNGKKFIVKSDKKGIAKVTINKAFIKKLKVGKTVYYQVNYLKNTIKRSVKVKK